MQLSRIDLNLFTVFEAIYQEGGITPASRRLHLSQPAISHALARLRETLGDPLFERRGNQMIPTPLARSLAASVSQSLGSLQQALDRTDRFEPSASRRSFTIAARETQEAAFLPALIQLLAGQAPGIDIATVRIDRHDLEDDLESGAIDAALDVALPMPPEIRQTLVSASPLVVLVRRDHPLVKRVLDLDTYLRLEHVQVTGRRHGGGHEDVALGHLGLARRVRVRCQRHSVALEIARRSDLAVTLPAQQAEARRPGPQLRRLPFPAQIGPMQTYLYWHANTDADTASAWFRQAVLSVLNSAL